MLLLRCQSGVQRNRDPGGSLPGESENEMALYPTDRTDVRWLHLYLYSMQLVIQIEGQQRRRTLLKCSQSLLIWLKFPAPLNIS